MFCDVLVTLVVGQAATVAENGVAADENTAADNDRDTHPANVAGARTARRAGGCMGQLLCISKGQPCTGVYCVL